MHGNHFLTLIVLEKLSGSVLLFRGVLRISVAFFGCIAPLIIAQSYPNPPKTLPGTHHPPKNDKTDPKIKQTFIKRQWTNRPKNKISPK